MAKEKTQTTIKRYTILFDVEVYAAGKKACKDRKIKMFEYLNMLVSSDTGIPVTADLRHQTKESLENIRGAA